MSRPRYPAEDHGQYLFDLADETREPLYTIEEAAALLDLDPRKIGPRGANRRRSELYRSRTLPLAPSRKRARGDRLFIRGVLAMSGGVFTEAALPSLLPRGRLQPRRPWNPAARWPGPPPLLSVFARSVTVVVTISRVESKSKLL